MSILLLVDRLVNREGWGGTKGVGDHVVIARQRALGIEVKSRRIGERRGA